MKQTIKFRSQEDMAMAKHAFNVVNQIRLFNKLPILNEKEFYAELLVERAILLLEEIDKKRKEERDKNKRDNSEKSKNNKKEIKKKEASIGKSGTDIKESSVG